MPMAHRIGKPVPMPINSPASMLIESSQAASATTYVRKPRLTLPRPSWMLTAIEQILFTLDVMKAIHRLRFLHRHA